MKTRDKYITYLHRKLDEWNGDIDRLVDKVERVDAESRVQLKEQIQTLRNKRDGIEAKISEMSASGADAWEDLKGGMELAREAMNAAIKSATNRFFK